MEETIMKYSIGLIMTLLTASVWAGTPPGPGTLPEPGTLSLLAIGAAGGLVIWMRNRNKKK